MEVGARFSREEDTGASGRNMGGAAPPKAGMRVLAGVGALTLLAFLVRVWRLDHQSVWMDEWGYGLCFLSAPNLWTFLDLVRIGSREVVPVYFIFEYFWAHLAGTSEWLLRLPGTVAGTACVPLIYVVGARIRGRWTGAVAALCMALSPWQIFRSQDLLPYSFCVPLALLSLWGLLRGLQDDDAKGWLLMLAANILLLCTHLTFVGFVLAQMAFLCFGLYRTVLTRWGWIAAQAAFLLAWGIYTSTLGSSWEPDSVQQPLILTLGYNVLCRDLTTTLDNPPAWSPELPASLLVLVKFHLVADVIICCVVCAALVWLVYYWLRHCLRPWLTGRREYGAALQAHTLVLFLFVGPLCLLLFLASVGYTARALGPRYSLYLAVPIYLAIGGLLAVLPGRRLRLAAIAGLAAVYGYQAAIFLPATVRPDWHGVGQYVRQHVQPDDIVLMRGFSMDAEVVAHALKGVDAPLIYVSSYPMLLDAANYLLADAGAGSGHPARTVWIIQDGNYDLNPPLSGFLRPCGLDAHSKAFCGGVDMSVWQVRRASGTTTPSPSLRFRRNEKHDQELLAELGIEHADARTRRLFFSLHDGRFETPKYDNLILTYDLLQAGRNDLAQRTAAIRVKLDGKFALGHLAMAMVALCRGDVSSVRQSFEDAGRYNAPAQRMLQELKEACCSSDPQRITNAIAHLESLRLTLISIPWRQVYRVTSGEKGSAWPPGLYPFNAADYDRLGHEFASLRMPESLPAESLARIGEFLETAGRLSEAVNAYGRALLKDPSNRRAQEGLAACAEGTAK